MQTPERITFKGNLPKKQKFFVALFWLDFKLLQLILKPLIKKFFLRRCTNSDFIPGFRCLYGNIICESVFLADATYLDYAPIYIGKGTNIGFGCTFITSSHNSKDYKEIICDPIWIGENCFIGTNSIILQGVKIGNNSIIGAGSVVTKDVPENCIVAGNPAKFIKTF